MDFKDFVQKTMDEHADGDGPTAQECWDYMAREIQAACRSEKASAELAANELREKILSEMWSARDRNEGLGKVECVDVINHLMFTVRGIPFPTPNLDETLCKAQIDEHKRYCQTVTWITYNWDNTDNTKETCSDVHPCERLKELRGEKTHGK